MSPRPTTGEVRHPGAASFQSPFNPEMHLPTSSPPSSQVLNVLDLTQPLQSRQELCLQAHVGKLGCTVCKGKIRLYLRHNSDKREENNTHHPSSREGL